MALTKGIDNPYFATVAGGVLQSVWIGTGGLGTSSKEIIQIKTALPDNWKA